MTSESNISTSNKLKVLTKKCDFYDTHKCVFNISFLNKFTEL